MVQWIVFVLLSVAILYVSRASLRAWGSHGFYRFFAWEAILGLLCMNVTFWFERPFAWFQVTSWLLLWLSLVPLYYGVRTLVARGKPSAARAGQEPLLAFEKTTQLVTTGIYRYIRHPLYSSLWFLAWGVLFKHPTWFGFALATLASLALYATARADETECIRYFGEPYRDYMKHSKRFIPYVF